MKILESSPRRYDTGIKILTWGKITEYHDYMASLVREDQKVLDLGCGTGLLSIKLARSGAHVTAIDVNPQMLDIAKQKITKEESQGHVVFQLGDVLDIDEIESDCFDVITASLLFSELNDNERRYLLKNAKKILKPGGKFIIGDETVPRSIFKRILNVLLRIPLVLITYMLTQTTTKPVKQLDQMLSETGFELVEIKENWLGNFTIHVAQKPFSGEDVNSDECD